jgi:hypothetical protein
MYEKRKLPDEFDLNVIAKSIVSRATHEELLPQVKREHLPTFKEKNPAAVALGRLGGLKGGKARAEKLSAKKRKAIAQKAAEARWKKDRT